MLGTVLLIVLVILLIGALGLWILGERGRLMRPSTWKGLRAGGLRSLLNLNALHMYIYGRWTNQYLDVFINRIFPRLGERDKKWWRDRYHGKIITQEQAEAFVVLDHDISRRDLEQIISYPMARDLVLKGPPMWPSTSVGAAMPGSTPVSRLRCVWSLASPLWILFWSTIHTVAAA